MDSESRLVSRSEAARMLRPHVGPIMAMACAADRAATALSSGMAPGQRRVRYQPKLRGQVSAALWTEGVREWVEQAKPPGLRVHAPFDWTELLVHEELHVRIQKERDRPDTPRRDVRASQQPCGTIPLFMLRNGPITNIDINAVYSDLGILQAVRITAPLDKGHVWTPIQFGLRPAIRQLESWQRRGVPWLEVCGRTAAMASYEELLSEVTALREAVAHQGPVSEMPARDAQPRATFNAKKHRDEGRDTGM